MSNPPAALSFKLPAPAYWPGETVYHRADGARGVVVGIYFTKKDILYDVSWGSEVSNHHYGHELSAARPIDGVDDGD